MCNIQFKWTLLFVLLGVFTLTAFGETAKNKRTESPIAIPLPAFEVEHTRSDPKRPTRSSGRIYDGPLIDTHAHLYPPHGRAKAAAGIGKRELKEIIRLMNDLGVEHVILCRHPMMESALTKNWV